MKKIIVLIPVFVFAMFHAQSLTGTENYIYSRTYLEPVTTEQAAAKQIQSVQYFDGLGRVAQTTAIKASPTGKDMVVPSVYDNDGRQTKSYLPLPVDSQNGAYLTGATESAVNSYYGIPNAFAEVSVEKSPLARSEKAAAPGTDWQMSSNHTQKAEYLTNGINEVKRFQAVTTWNPSSKINDVAISLVPNNAYTTNGYYNANILNKIVTKDEENNESQTFTNSLGQNILVRKVNKKQNGTTENLDTYYVYDEFGNLSAIIPPKASGSVLSSALLDQFCYQYKYDKYNRQVEKKIPGKGWIYMVYDQQNRMVATQDPNLKAKGQWVYTKYDQFGRVAFTGISSGGERIAEQNLADSFGNNNVKRTTSVFFNREGLDVYYDPNGTYPNVNWVKLLTVNYYDSYPGGSPLLPGQIQNQNTLPSEPTAFTSNGISSIRSTKTLPTAGYTKNIENDNWSASFIWYDRQGRVIGAYAKNHLGGFTKAESVLDFSGKTLETYTYHSKSTPNTEITVKDRFVYTPQNYLSKHYQQINSNPEELLTEYTYNDLGQVINKKTGNNLQSIDFTYNIKGWLTGINPGDIGNLGSKLFAYKIKYNQREGAETPNNEYTDLKVTPRYDGSIAEVDWKTASDNILRRYGYVYDGASRLKAGFYQNDTNPYLKEYNEIVDYDSNGNITNLKRTALSFAGTSQLIDDLTYTYNGNILTNVSDTSQNYGGYPLPSGNLIDYDDNGNMTSQKDKGINQIAYNILNLPSSVIYNSTYIIQDPFFGQIERNVNNKYTYSANGEKLSSQYTYFVGKSQTEITRITDYLDNFQYENNILQFYANEEGYYDFVQNRYIYNYKDHLGNIRLSYYKQTDGTARILEENNYYPFGLRHTGYTPIISSTYRYKYNGKEVQDSGMYDYGWRQYMPELGRWNGMDQLSEKYHSFSPFAYVMNNPVNMFDPDGRLSQAQINYMWDNSGPGVTTWDFNTDGSPRMTGHYAFNDSVHNAIASAYAAAGSGGGGGGGNGSSGGFGGSFGGGSGFGGFGGGSYSTFSYWTNGNLYADKDGYQSIQELINWNIKIYTPNNVQTNNIDWYGPGGKTNWFLATAAASTENFSGIARVGSNWKIYQATQTGRVFYGNQYVKTFSIGRIGNLAGKASFGLGLAMDTYGAIEWAKDKKSPNAVHPAKGGLNTTIGAIGVWGGPPGAIISTLYFGVDNFYPGGWVGASETATRTEVNEQQMTGHPFLNNSAIKF
jgi:RHS repeat-associated protein